MRKNDTKSIQFVMLCQHCQKGEGNLLMTLKAGSIKETFSVCAKCAKEIVQKFQEVAKNPPIIEIEKGAAL
jgi:protein-arginine kinase activator protein McsA